MASKKDREEATTVSVSNNPVSKGLGDLSEGVTGMRSTQDMHDRMKQNPSNKNQRTAGSGLAGPTKQDFYDMHTSNMPTFANAVTADGSYDIGSINHGDLKGYDISRLDPDAQRGYSISSLDPDKMRGYDTKGYDTTGYDVDERGYQELGDLQMQDAMNFDPYRRNALQDIDASTASGQATAEGAMQRSGGLTAADRMAMASEFNRNKIQGRQGALGKYDEMEAQNLYQTNMANADTANRGTLWGADQRVANEADRASQQNQQNAYLASQDNQQAKYLSDQQNQQNAYLANQQNQAMTQNTQAQPAANQYLAGQQNQANLYNAEQQTAANQYLSNQQNDATRTNVESQNAYAKDSADRKRQAETDAYNAKFTEWDKQGQILSAK